MTICAICCGTIADAARLTCGQTCHEVLVARLERISTDGPRAEPDKCQGCGGNGEANSTSPMYQYNVGGRCTYCGGSGLQRDFIPMSKSGGLKCSQP